MLFKMELYIFQCVIAIRYSLQNYIISYLYRKITNLEDILN